MVTEILRIISVGAPSQCSRERTKVRSAEISPEKMCYEKSNAAFLSYI